VSLDVSSWECITCAITVSQTTLSTPSPSTSALPATSVSQDDHVQLRYPDAKGGMIQVNVVFDPVLLDGSVKRVAIQEVIEHAAYFGESEVLVKKHRKDLICVKDGHRFHENLLAPLPNVSDYAHT
jgi:hypothetical protein